MNKVNRVRDLAVVARNAAYITFLVFGFFAASMANAQTNIGNFDAAGVSVDPPGTPTRTFVLPTGYVDEIDFDLSVAHFSPSWGSETRITVTAPGGVSRTYAGNTDFGWSNSSGTFSFNGTLPFPGASATGTWTLTFSDTFADGGPSPDMVFNAGSTIGFISETTPPVATSVSIASNNTDTARAGNSDTVTISMTFNETLSTAPTVTLLGQSATVAGGGTTWSATTTANAASPQGVATFNISGYQDIAGNTGAAVSATTNATSVTVDTIAPAATAVTIASDNADPTIASVGDEVTLDITFNEAIAAAPTVSLMGQTVVATGSGTTWSAAATVQASTSSGAAAFAVSGFSDVTGNAGSDVSATTDSSEVIIDTDAPTVSVASIASDNALDLSIATIGDVVSLTLEFSQPLASAPAVALMGQSATVSGSGTSWTASATVISSTPQGIVSFTISGYEDEAGNDGADVSSVTDGSSVTIDSGSPALTISGVPADFTAGDVFTVTFSFGEDVTGFAVDDVDVAGAATGALSGGPATYTMEITPDASGNVTIDVAEAAALDVAGNSSAAASASSTLRSDVAASEAIAEFMLNRGRNIVQSQPGLLGYLNGSQSGDLTASASRNGDARLSFGTRMDRPVWMSLQASKTKHEDDTETTFLLGAVGGHMLMNDGLLLGAMLQFDYSDEALEDAATIEGKGWMVGPYVLGQFGDQPFFYEARALWGKSTNEISPFGTFSDEFQTERFLALGAVEGRFDADGYRVFPRLELSHFKDTQLAYTDAIYNAVPEQSIAMTEFASTLAFEKPIAVTVGEHLLTWSGTSTISILDADGASEAYIDSYGNARLRADVGYRFASDDGFVISTDAFVDGIGKNAFTTVGVALNFEMSF